MILNIPKEDVEYCIAIGTQRYLRKYGSKDQPNYARGKEDGKLEHELVANIRTFVAECAVALATERSWGGAYVYSNRFHPHRKTYADVGSNIEVRTIRTVDSVPIWEKDSGKIIFCCEVVEPEYFSKVKIHGYVEAEKAMTSEYIDTYIDGWRYPIALLTPLIPPSWLEVSLVD